MIPRKLRKWKIGLTDESGSREVTAIQQKLWNHGALAKRSPGSQAVVTARQR